MTIDSRIAAWSSTTRTETAGARLSSASSTNCRDRLTLIGTQRKTKSEGASLPFLARNLHLAGVRFDHALDDGEAEAGAVRFGGVERLEDFLAIFGTDPLSGVGDDDFDVAFPRPLHPNGQHPSARHRLDCVHEEVP